MTMPSNAVLLEKLQNVSKEIIEIKDHLKKLNGNVDTVQNDSIKIKAKVNLYSILTPILVGIIGFLVSRFF